MSEWTAWVEATTDQQPGAKVGSATVGWPSYGTAYRGSGVVGLSTISAAGFGGESLWSAWVRTITDGDIVDAVGVADSGSWVGGSGRVALTDSLVVNLGTTGDVERVLFDGIGVDDPGEYSAGWDRVNITDTVTLGGTLSPTKFEPVAVTDYGVVEVGSDLEPVRITDSLTVQLLGEEPFVLDIRPRALAWLLDTDTLRPATVLERVSELRLTERLWGGVSFRMRSPWVPVDVDQILAFSVGQTEPTLMGLVEDVDPQLEVDEEILELRGRDPAGLFSERLVIPPDGESHDSETGAAETVMLGYISRHAGPQAVEERQFPGMAVATSGGNGSLVRYEARFRDLDEVLEAVGRVDGYGYRTVYTGSGYRAEVIVGRDQSSFVWFDAEVDAILALRWLRSKYRTKNVAYVAGQGEGVDRDVATVGAGSGWQRRELFVDARDIPDPALLVGRGQERLSEMESVDRVEFDANSQPYEYGRDYALGDLVTVRDRKWGLSMVGRVVQVETTVRAGHPTTRRLQVGDFLPTLSDRVIYVPSGTERS